eukprot:scaffold1220_cov376-Prasinococcus_capsulatus_cf.AAC.9
MAGISTTKNHVCEQIIAGEDFRKLAPVFSEVVNATAHDQAAIAEFGWTRDMFAWDIAVIKVRLTCAMLLPARGMRLCDLALQAGMRQQCVSPPPAGFFSQPPHDQVGWDSARHIVSVGLSGVRPLCSAADFHRRCLGRRRFYISRGERK